jgi:hypothetical protein
MNPPPIHASVDFRIWSRELRSTKVAQGFSGKHNESHVLLAACGREQAAFEDPHTRSGLFTGSLLRTLDLLGVYDLTYTALVHHLSMPPW